MNLKWGQGLLVAATLSVAGLLAGCADGDGSDDLIKIIEGGGGGGGGSDDFCVANPQSVLDGVQCSVTTLVDDLAGILAGTPLENFVQCIDPLGNDVVEGPDSVLNTLLAALAEQNPDPSDFQAALADLAQALASLGTNLPAALQALGGDPEAIAYCNGGPPPGGGGGIPLDPDQLSGLCAIPTIGPGLIGALGGTCP
jgi:hypothetical protein